VQKLQPKNNEIVINPLIRLSIILRHNFWTRKC